MSRLRPTHKLTAERYGAISCEGDGDCLEGTECVDGVCVDDYNQPVEDNQTVIEGLPVRYHPNGSQLTRSEAGEDVIDQPAIEGRSALLEDLRAGDLVTLEPIAGDDPTVDGLEASGNPIPAYGRRASASKAHVELQTA